MTDKNMEKVTVYAFTLYDPSIDDFAPAKGKAMSETIAKEGGRLVPGTAEDVLISALNAKERYHSPQSNPEA